MKSKVIISIMACFVIGLNVQGQALLNKVKKKAGENIVNKLGSKTNSGNKTNTGSQDGNSNPSNKVGGGLTSTPPDVTENLSDAESAYNSSRYGDARYAVQQAMLGVEMQIGNKVLQSLPLSVSGLKNQPDEDQVTSAGYGWVGLTIARVYSDGDDKELRTTVANNSAWMSAVNVYLSSGGYAQTTGGQQNWKQTKVKGYRAIIEYTESSGYKLSVPLGQTSLVVLEGVNFANESDMMSAANAFDYDGIKKMLGEQ